MVARFFQMYRDEAEKAGYQASPDQLAWSNTIYVAETDEKAMREARPHLEALANRFLKMPTEMLLPPGYSNIDSIKRIRAAKITGKPQTIEDLVKNGVVIVGSPNTVREKLADYQDLAGFNTSLTKTQFGTHAGRHDARQHDGDRRGDPAALPQSPAAGQAGRPRRSEPGARAWGGRTMRFPRRHVPAVRNVRCRILPCPASPWRKAIRPVRFAGSCPIRPAAPPISSPG